jgi:shikimate dehydrogenase
LVYNPAETQFMKKGRERGAAVMNGLSMLKFQADEAFEIWTK